MSDFLPSVSGVGGFLLMALGFSFVIFVHELGHFLVAKWSGIKCTQFAVGFGKPICTWRKGFGLRWLKSTEPEVLKQSVEYLKRKHPDMEFAGEEGMPSSQQLDEAFEGLGISETEYRLNQLPLGGYVKMLGQEDLNPDATSTDPRSFNQASFGARAAVISAGVIMNIIFGVIFFIAAFMMGLQVLHPVVGETAPDFPASTTYAEGHEGELAYLGLQPGDRIVEINGKKVKEFTEIVIAVALGGEEKVHTIVVERDGEPEPLVYQMQARRNPANGLYALGFEKPVSLKLPDDAEKDRWPDYLADSDAAPGMRIVAIDGKPVDDYGAYRRIINSSDGRPLDVTLKSPQDDATATVRVPLTPQWQWFKWTDRDGDEQFDIHLMGFRPALTVGALSKDHGAEQAGLKIGDMLARAGGTAWPTFDQLQTEAEKAAGKTIDIEVIRDGKRMTFEDVKVSSKGIIGIARDFSDAPIVVGAVPDSPATALNLPGGSTIDAVAGNEVATFADIKRILSDHARRNPDGFDIDVTARPNIAGAQPETQSVTVSADSARQLARLGWTSALASHLMFDTYLLQADDIFHAAGYGISKAHISMMQVYLTIARLFDGSVPVNQLQGFVGIAATGTRVAREGMPLLLFFFGLISVNLAVINFLPIPIVDGGLMVFLIAEKLKGSPVSIRVQNAATIVGLVLIGTIFLVTLYFDIVREFGV